MKKISVLYFDNERQKYRIAMGERQNIHIGRYDTLEEAQRVQMAIMKAYEEGEKAALKEVEQRKKKLEAWHDELSELSSSLNGVINDAYETAYTNGFDNGVRWGFSKGLDHAKDAVEQESMNVDVAIENDIVQECIEQAKTVGDYEGA